MRPVHWTTVEEPTTVANLQRFNEILDLKLFEEEVNEMIVELNDHIEHMSRVPCWRARSYEF
jgi:hypothetical protein